MFLHANLFLSCLSSWFGVLVSRVTFLIDMILVRLEVEQSFFLYSSFSFSLIRDSKSVLQ